MQYTLTETKWPKTLFDDEEPRAEGLHLGVVIKSLMEASGLGYKGDGFTDMELTAEIGLLWEDMLSRVMGVKYAIRPGQMESDGIWMSPDGIAPDPEGEVPLAVEEYKATWKSTLYRGEERPPTEDFYYMAQLKSYCRVVGTTVGVMRIFHIMGDYHGSGPLYRVVRIVFTKRELEDNWKMILKHKEDMDGH